VYRPRVESDAPKAFRKRHKQPLLAMYNDSKLPEHAEPVIRYTRAQAQALGNGILARHQR
jgi:hypothetical protein